MEKLITIPTGVTLEIKGAVITAKGSKGSNSMNFAHMGREIKIVKEGETVLVKTDGENKVDKRIVGTVRAHIKNLINGVIGGYKCKLSVFYSHFPIVIKVEEKRIRIENLSGGRAPRYADIIGDCKVEVKGQIITVTGLDKENVGQTAANIEMATRTKKKDKRVFTDGIWIVSKGGNE